MSPAGDVALVTDSDGVMTVSVVILDSMRLGLVIVDELGIVEVTLTVVALEVSCVSRSPSSLLCSDDVELLSVFSVTTRRLATRG